MAAYRIETRAAGTLGEYPGDTALDALDACARDAGYASHAAACEAIGADPGDWTTEPWSYRHGSASTLVQEIA